MRSRTSNKPKTGRFNGSKSAVVLFLAAAAAVFIARAGWTEEGRGEVNVQGGWAYTARNEGGAEEHVAATRATEDAVWFRLACRADGRLTVSFVHSEHFQDENEQAHHDNRHRWRQPRGGSDMRQRGTIAENRL